VYILHACTAAALGGLDRVQMVVRKDPSAWYGTIAEDNFDLGGIRTEPVTLFEGTAREGAALYPQNVNIRYQLRSHTLTKNVPCMPYMPYMPACMCIQLHTNRAVACWLMVAVCSRVRARWNWGAVLPAACRLRDVSAAVALAGVGLDRTELLIVAGALRPCSCRFLGLGCGCCV
jgi:hypothetical protein